MEKNGIDARVVPEKTLELLSHDEVALLRDQSAGGLYDLFRRCSLAVLNSGSVTDSSKEVLEQFKDFEIKVIDQNRGIKLEVFNAPSSAFVDGQMIAGVREHLFAVLRDVIYVNFDVADNPKLKLDTSEGLTNAVFHILRNANALKAGTEPNLVVCWGGHSINRTEYKYTKEIGYQLGIRGLDICTGSGPGAMKGPMKGATIGHAKQRIEDGRYIGLSEPGIIAAESPNPIVNHLVIMPDIEKRLEAFVRMAHGIIVFPGGAGTAEEILYILGILLHPDNKSMPFPLLLTGPKESADYFEQINEFIGITVGKEAQDHYKIIVDDPEAAARFMKAGMDEVRSYRREHSDAYYYNWLLKIEEDFQKPFIPTHENMAKLALHKNQPAHKLAAHLRRAFSGIVAGNVKEDGIRAIEEHGPFEIHGELDIMEPLDKLLQSFVDKQRMKLPGTKYIPCYKLVK